jgi:Holliday junction resolvase
MRRTHRRDKTHAAIVTELRQMGYSVADTSTVGNDFPDLVIGRRGVTALVEAKSRSRESHVGRVTDPAVALLTDGQRRFRDAWRGSRVLVGYDAIEIHAAFVQLCAP